MMQCSLAQGIRLVDICAAFEDRRAQSHCAQHRSFLKYGQAPLAVLHLYHARVLHEKLYEIVVGLAREDTSQKKLPSMGGMKCKSRIMHPHCGG